MAKIPYFDSRDLYFYNPVINGNFDYWQRSTSTAISPTSFNQFIADKVQTANGAAALNATVSRSTVVPPDAVYPAAYSWQIQATGSNSFNGNHEMFVHTIEKNFWRPFINKDFTIGVWVFAPYALAVWSLRVGLGTRNYIHIQSLVSGWNYVCVNVPAEPLLTAANDIDGAAQIHLGHQQQAGFRTSSVNQWITFNGYTQTGGHTNYLALNGDTLRYSQLQVRLGHLSADEMNATFRTTGANPIEEFRLCQRYFQLGGMGTGVGVNATTVDLAFALSPEMRSTPVVSTTGAVQITDQQTTDFTQTGANAATVAMSARGCRVRLAQFIGITVGRFYSFEPDGGAWVTFSSEL